MVRLITDVNDSIGVRDGVAPRMPRRPRVPRSLLLVITGNCSRKPAYLCQVLSDTVCAVRSSWLNPKGAAHDGPMFTTTSVHELCTIQLKGVDTTVPSFLYSLADALVRYS